MAAFVFEPEAKGSEGSLIRTGKCFKHPQADAENRRIFPEKIEDHKKAGRPTVYINESGFAHDMPRTDGYATKAKRCFDTHNWQAQGHIKAYFGFIESQFLVLALL